MIAVIQPNDRRIIMKHTEYQYCISQNLPGKYRIIKKEGKYISIENVMISIVQRKPSNWDIFTRTSSANDQMEFLPLCEHHVSCL